MSEYTYFQFHQREAAVVVQLVNPNILDDRLVGEVIDELIHFVEQEEPHALVVSFELVSHCSSLIIGGLIRMKKRVATHRGQLVLCAMLPDIRKIFEVTNLDGTVFQIFDTEEQAVEALS